MAKTTKTYSINKKTYELFDRITKQKNVNKSSFIESKIKDYLSDNLGFDDELYQSKMDEDIVVSIIGSDDTFFELSDGSRISKIMFYHNYKGYDAIDPKDFFATSPAFKIVEKVKEMGDEFENVEIGIPSIGKTVQEKIQSTMMETNAFFNKGSEGIMRKTDNKVIKTDNKVIKTDNKVINEFTHKMKVIIDLYKKGDETWKNTPLSHEIDEKLFFDLRSLSDDLKKEFNKSKYLKSKFRNTKLKVNKGVKLLIDIERKGLMNEEILDIVGKLKKED